MLQYNILAKAINISTINFKRERLNGQITSNNNGQIISNIQWDGAGDRARLNQKTVSQTWTSIVLKTHSISITNFRLGRLNGQTMFQTVSGDKGGDRTRLNRNNFSHQNYKFGVLEQHGSKNNIWSTNFKRGRLNGETICQTFRGMVGRGTENITNIFIFTSML